MRSKKREIFIAIAAIAVVFAIVFTAVSLVMRSQKELTQEEAVKMLNDYYSDIKKDVHSVQPRYGEIEQGYYEVLPDINKKYPLVVTGDAELDIEIFSSTEKAGPVDAPQDRWLVDVAQKFNKENYVVDGKHVSVSIRSISSGVGIDYIVSGEYVPTAYSPSNVLFGEYLNASGVQTQLKAERIAGNTTGILIKKDIKDEFLKEYNEVNIETFIEAAASKKYNVGYTNPFVSATGLNTIVSALYSFDPDNLFSNTAIEEFKRFQAAEPYTAYSTIQLRNANYLDMMVMEYQAYINKEELKEFDFVPFGIRHDNPVYSIGKISESEEEVLDMFIEYCLNDKNQKSAEDYGFNQYDTYISPIGTIDGESVIQAQKLWKQNKDGGRPVITVFVADTSGSMNGSAINNLQDSLIKASSYINENNYIGLVSYNSDVYLDMPISKFDNEHRSLYIGAVEQLSANGSTKTGHGLIVALKLLKDMQEEIPNAKLQVILLSDGAEDPILKHSASSLEEMLKTLSIPVITIGYNVDDSTKKALQDISNVNESVFINADSGDIEYELKNLFNAKT